MKPPRYVRTQFNADRFIADDGRIELLVQRNADETLTIGLGAQSIKLTAVSQRALMTFLQSLVD